MDRQPSTPILSDMAYRTMNETAPYLSVLLPVYNEVDNLRPLYEDLKAVLDTLHHPYEILLIDDGSQDGSVAEIRALAAENPAVKAIILRRNFGQTAAITAGLDHAQGQILILMDADRQNDPRDIPALIKPLAQGFDIVSGWRKNRQDPFLTSVLPSRIANWIIGKLTGVRIHDHGCTLKAYRRDILENVSLYGETHRFISIFGHWIGAKVTEIEVHHHPRTRGKSKYSIAKSFKVLLDLPLLILLGTYLTRPMHFFGKIGGGFSLLGFLCACSVLYEKWVDPLAKAHRNPILLLAVFFALMGVQILMIGLLAELITRVYHESQQKKTYFVAEKIGLEPKQTQP
ncbi:MAG: glycosyltransferase family 2 protein [bacterium]|nr:glycosyltransferase family 2 protein [bacterium]